MTWLFFGTLIFAIASVVLVLIILAQRPSGGGLSGAFGGAGGGGTDTAFGGRTGDVLTYATIGAFIGYLAIAVTLNIIDNKLLAADQNEIAEALNDPAAAVPTAALETVPPAALTPTTPDASTANIVTPTPPIGSTENDLPGQE